MISDKMHQNTNKEALYFRQLKNGVQCVLCPRFCFIREGEKGFCRNRINIENRLFTNAYNNLCAVHIDSIEKKPLYHFYPGSKTFSIATAGCNLTCKNCQNNHISQTGADQTKTYFLSPENIVEETLKNYCKSISFTYTEPTIFFEYMLETAILSHKKGIKNVIVSNGYINKEPLLELIPYIDAANIDIKAFDNNIYKKLCGAALQPVLDTLVTLHENHIWLEITNLLIPGWTDDFNMIEQMCEWFCKNNLADYPLHFSRFIPQFQLQDEQATPFTTLEKAYHIAKTSGMKYVYLGNVHGRGLENTVCPECKKNIVERTGYKIMNIYIENNCCEFCGKLIIGQWN